MDRTQAEALTWAIGDSVKHATAHLATKAEMDIRFDKVDTKFEKMDAKIDRVRVELKEEMHLLRAELNWLPLRVCWWILLPLATATGLLLIGRQLLTIFG